MATLGALDLDCPICGRELHIPVFAVGPTIVDDRLTFEVDFDRDYVTAHLLTHRPHDGQPVDIAA